MNRRTFLTTLAAGAAGFALDPERLLWVPGRKTIFLPQNRPLACVAYIEPCTFTFWRNRRDEPLDFTVLGELGADLRAAWTV